MSPVCFPLKLCCRCDSFTVRKAADENQANLSCTKNSSSCTIFYFFPRNVLKCFYGVDATPFSQAAEAAQRMMFRAVLERHGASFLTLKFPKKGFIL